jgi:site-specific recombinase XerD
LLAILYRGGLRISEALALEKRDLDVRACTLAIRHGKRDRHRTIGMNSADFALLTNWLEERKHLPKISRRPYVVFCTLEGEQLRASYVRALLPRLARKAGIEKRVHPQGLRHTCAAELALEGVPVPLIRQQLGHASLQTTTVYLRHIAPVELVEKMRQRTWEL